MIRYFMMASDPDLFLWMIFTYCYRQAFTHNTRFYRVSLIHSGKNKCKFIKKPADVTNVREIKAMNQGRGIYMDVSSSGRSKQLIFFRRVLHKCFAIIKRENKQREAELICGHLYGENGVACTSPEMRTRQTNLQERKFTGRKGSK